MSQWTRENILSATREFMEARVILTGAELGVFTLLSGELKSADEITSALGTKPRGMVILLDALTAMGLLTKNGGKYTSPPEVAASLSAESPQTVLPMVKHAAGLWQRWSQLTDIIRQGSVDRPPAVFEEQEQLEAFILAMHVLGRHAADEIAEQAQANACTNLLDVGGATGTYAEAFLRKYPDMRATVFDRPPVIELARKRLIQTDVVDRITLTAGDFYTDELPSGHDLALLSAIIHQNSLEQNLELCRKVYRALVPGGRILIRDHVMSPDRTHPPAGAMFAVNMLVATTGGNCYTFDEVRTALDAAGFTQINLVQSGEMMDALVEAFKP